MSDLSPECAPKQTCIDHTELRIHALVLDSRVLVCAAARDLPVVPIRRSVLTCDVGQITGSFPRVSCPPEGRFAIVTKRGAGDAVDAKAPKDERCLCGRRSRGVLISRRWYQPADDAEASRRGWWQESPITRETTKETVKAIARGMPGDSGVTVVTLLTCFLYLHVRPRAQWAPGIPCALWFRGVKIYAPLGRKMCRGIASARTSCPGRSAA